MRFCSRTFQKRPCNTQDIHSFTFLIEDEILNSEVSIPTELGQGIVSLYLAEE